MDNSHNKNIPAGESRTEQDEGEEKEEEEDDIKKERESKRESKGFLSPAQLSGVWLPGSKILVLLFFFFSSFRRLLLLRKSNSLS